MLEDAAPIANSGFMAGDGLCSKCHGTGINTQLDSAQPKCPFCEGTGVCSTCGGSGNQSEPVIDSGIQRLFE
jgi:DnaJ-class molecular chaperone